MHMPKPYEGDFNPYWGDYINAVQEGNLVQLLKDQVQELLSLYSSISEEQSLYRYDEGKWSLKERDNWYSFRTDVVKKQKWLCAHCNRKLVRSNTHV